MSPESDVPLYAGVPLPYSTDPVFLSQKNANFIESRLTEILKDLENFTTEVLKDPASLRRLGLPGDLPPEPTPLGIHIPFARFDFLFDGTNLNILELNTDGTSGYNTTEWLAKKARIPDDRNPNKDLSLKLLKAIQKHSPDNPDIILMDFSTVETNWEQRDLVRRWQSYGYEKTKIADPSHRTWQSGSVAYRRALSWQLRSFRDLAKPFLDDWESKKISVLGGWSSDVGMSKAWPALMKVNEVPNTEIVHRFLVRRLKDEKDQWILKGALSHSGNAVMRGIDWAPERWDVMLDKALVETENGRPWIAQKKIAIPLVDSKPCEFGLFFLNGVPSGYMCRWGHTDIINEKSLEILRPVQIQP